MRTARLAAVLLAGLALSAAAGAPELGAQVSRPAARQTASINLIGVPFGFISGEYERAIGANGFALGLGGVATFDTEDGADLLDFGDGDQFRSLQLKAKYYPSANGLRGFAVGLTGGFASARGYEYTYTQIGNPTTGISSTTRRITETKPTLGAVLDYNFLIGRQRRFLIGLGVGARRVLGGRRRYNSIVDGTSEIRSSALGRTLADGRLQIGVGF